MNTVYSNSSFQIFSNFLILLVRTLLVLMIGLLVYKYGSKHHWLPSSDLLESILIAPWYSWAQLFTFSLWLLYLFWARQRDLGQH